MAKLTDDAGETSESPPGSSIQTAAAIHGSFANGATNVPDTVISPRLSPLLCSSFIRPTSPVSIHSGSSSPTLVEPSPIGPGPEEMQTEMQVHTFEVDLTRVCLFPMARLACHP
ncbi:unnamed protein product [Protopolystoma xenopodis]|uniref:Uncharacterized protein n=1 Tax=Protopolystoma xenopodis TaxID=117903 RepID=A0A448WGR7_9PLAT|nr:unnamed protein product [Protopolystoma xenopodis]